MQALPSPSAFTPSNVACSSPISTNPKPTATISPDLVAALKSPMADLSSPTAAEAGANKENICPLTGLVANSVVSPKRRRFLRKPLADITSQFKQRDSSFDGLFDSSWSGDGQKKTVKRKADMGNRDVGEVKMNCRPKKLRMSFR